MSQWSSLSPAYMSKYKYTVGDEEFSTFPNTNVFNKKEKYRNVYHAEIKEKMALDWQSITMNTYNNILLLVWTYDITN